MLKVTSLELSSEEMKEAVQGFLANKFNGDICVEFVNKNGFYPQTSYNIRVTESL